MQTTGELEYEVRGDGDLLFIPPLRSRLPGTPWTDIGARPPTRRMKRAWFPGLELRAGRPPAPPRCHVVGFSSGGVVAFELAVSSPRRSDRSSSEPAPAGSTPGSASSLHHAGVR